ncbi:MAG: DUF2835 domain-containing protein [Gammaproteobacteria bacterium]|nr:DUF2835 domain-containing protein [Gammaproteobacteria bacterium]NND54569.1 DUF2835 domain-containing protein [Gammaproteobacteria bacterium]
MNNRFVVSLQIPADEFRRLYEGSANTVVSRDQVTGRSVRFPANVLRQFVESGGVFGRFEIETDADNRLQTIRRVQGEGSRA